MDKKVCEPTTKDRRRFAFDKANELWMSDVMHGPSVFADEKRKRKTYLIATLDDATRVVPYAAFAMHENTAAFLPAERKFLRALELNPSEVQALGWYALFLAVADRWEEARAKSMKAIEVDPLSAYTNAIEGVMYTFYGGSSPKAIEALKRALEIDPDHSVALYVSGMAFGRAGEHDQAIEALTRVSEISGRATYYLGLLAWSFGNAGREDEARSLLKELHERSKVEYVSRMIFACIHSGLRENDQAMEWLSRAVEERSPIRSGCIFRCSTTFVTLPGFRSSCVDWGFGERSPGSSPFSRRVHWNEAIQLIEPVLNEVELCRRRLVFSFVDHDEALAVAVYIVSSRD